MAAATTIDTAIRTTAQFIRERLLEPGPPERRPLEFKLRHAGPTGSRRITSARVRDGDAGELAAALAKALVSEAVTWAEACEAPEMPQRFLVVACSKEGTGDAHSFNLRGRPKPTGDVTVSEPATLLGQLTQQMRHNEIDARTHAEALSTLLEGQNYLVRTVIEDNKALREMVNQTFTDREALATQRFEREYAHKKLDADNARRDKMAGQVIGTVIPKAAGYAFAALERAFPALSPPKAAPAPPAPAPAAATPAAAPGGPVAPSSASKAPPVAEEARSGKEGRPEKGKKGKKGKKDVERVEGGWQAPAAPAEPTPAAPVASSAAADLATLKSELSAILHSLPDGLKVQIAGAVSGEQAAKLNALMAEGDD